ncbi:hypothetical protein TSAR_000888 [Trichomalopsis sarcophagae]|uniref:Uncharacterized protein n=1 Tax=Trichomalopsis sarcophagae TaxID=543379 RepID=A0A232EMZ3_9HYME|nr:hypothetical protein TSAR_000888 [Trichomalopsis sarcophagae]
MSLSNITCILKRIEITYTSIKVYKQMENARSFAEFSSLLIAKAKRKPANVSDKNKNEEYLKPLYENND